MDRATRDKFVSGTQADVTKGNARWETAPGVYEKLNADFGPFDLDLTADVENALCVTWLGPGSTLASDALAARWHLYGKNGYSNPPYGDFVPRMLAHAAVQALAPVPGARGCASTLLLPLRVTKAFQRHVLGAASELLFCDKRLTFFEGGKPRTARDRKTGKLIATPALFDSIVVRYVPGHYGPPRVGLWEVPKHVLSLTRYFTEAEINGQTAAPQSAS